MSSNHLFSLLKISDPVQVMQVLQDHAAKTVTAAPHHPSFMTSQALHPGTYDQVWQNIYSNPKLYQVVQQHIVHLPLPFAFRSLWPCVSPLVIHPLHPSSVICAGELS